MAQGHVFVSYSQADAGVVSPEIAWLAAAGIRLWYDDGIAAGDEWAESIGRAVRDSETVLVFLSPRWVASQHCRDEITMALNRDKPLVLVYLEPTELTPGLELRLSKTQAIIRHRMAESAYREKLVAALAREPVAGSPTRGTAEPPLTLFVGPAGKPPFLPDAVVLEEDTWLVMSGRNELEWPTDHPLRVIHSARSAEPESPGTVVVRRGRPHQLLAVVHDLGADPVCTMGWVEAALAKIVELTSKMEVGSLALPLMGTRYGRLDREVVLELTLKELARGGAFPRQVWLVTARAEAKAAREWLGRAGREATAGRTVLLGN